MMNDRIPIKGYEGLYEISSDGNIYSLVKNTVLKQHVGNNGYIEVRLKKDGCVKHKTVHRLLAIAFIPNPESKPCIDHIDGNKLNNELSNLKWCTYKENSNNPHSIKKCSENTKKAWRNGRKMSDEAIKKRSIGHYKKIAQYTLDGALVKIWDSIKEASINLNICRSQLSEACIGKRVKTARGFIFKLWIDSPEDKKSHITVDADKPLSFGKEPLAKINRI